MATTKKADGSTPIKFKDRVTVYSTGNTVKNGGHAEGKEMSVHPIQAEKLIASGKAITTAPTGTTAAKAKK